MILGKSKVIFRGNNYYIMSNIIVLKVCFMYVYNYENRGRKNTHKSKKTSACENVKKSKKKNYVKLSKRPCLHKKSNKTL